MGTFGTGIFGSGTFGDAEGGPPGSPVMMILQGGPLDGEMQVVASLPAYQGASLYFIMPNFQYFADDNETVISQGLEELYDFTGPGPDPGPDDSWTASWIYDFAGEVSVPIPPPIPPPT